MATDISGIAALEEPVRRALYEYVAGLESPVSRDQAASALGITRSLAAFHLDRLVSEDLLTVQFRRLSGRSGPGAGRPSKLYSRAERQLVVTLPPRSYALAARLLADAVERGVDVNQVAREYGRRRGCETPASRSGEDEIETQLRSHGYQPRRSPNGFELRNCPFHALAQEHPRLICCMNLAMLQGLLEGMGADCSEAVMLQKPDRCCVAITKL
ncbi:MAG: helix-turn-helix transcriptional regulator [Chloroflexota bacterium]